MKKIYSLIAGLLLAASVWTQVTTFSYTGALQTYTVPPGVTSIRIETRGAAGGAGLLGLGGRGAKMDGTFTVSPGEVLTILVGGAGISGTFVAGGGGGSFVWNSGTTLLIAAGGGGGGGYTDIGGTSYDGMNASITTNGTNGNSQAAGGGVGGNGGTSSLSATYASGGAGWNTNGINGTIHGCATNSIGGQRPLLGGAGGAGGGSAGAGGYGGGGGGNARCGAVGGGGGGGYSGGGPGGEVISGRFDGGGGGGSFNGGTNQTNTAGVGNGNGQVIITELCLATAGTSIISSCTPITWIDGNTYSSSNTIATHTLTNAEGCDSIVTLNFTRLLPTSSTSVISSCTPITWIDGNTYSTSNSIATHTLTNAAGCDSIVTLNYTRLFPSSGTSVINLCTPVTWIDGVTYSTSNNTATHILTNAAGCDSIVTLNYTRLFPSSGTSVITSCNPITWINGVTYTSSTNTPTFTLTNAAGCDSIVTLNLTINSLTDLSTTLAGTTITANNALATYQWLDCNNAFAIMPGQTNPSFTPLTNGSYAVQLNQSGCIDTSACVVINSVGINEPTFAESFTVYPNPGNGKIFIQFNSIQTEVNLTLYSILGEWIQQISVSNSSLIPYEMNVKSGIYLLKVTNSEHQEKTVRIIKE